MPEPHPNTVRVVVAVIFGLAALILAGSSVNSWSEAQGIGAALLGLSNRYELIALVEAGASFTCGLVCAMSARAAYRQGKPRRPFGLNQCDGCRSTVGPARLHWNGSQWLCDACAAKPAPPSDEAFERWQREQGGKP